MKKELKEFRKEQTRRLNERVDGLPSLTNTQKREIKQLSSELLHPTGPVDIPRPIPATCYKAHYAGMLTLDLDSSDVMLQVKPDPFRFVRVFTNSSQAVAGTGRLPSVDFSQAGTDDYGNSTPIGAADIFLAYPASAPLVSGSSLSSHFVPVVSGTGTLVNSAYVGWSNQVDMRLDHSNGWRACTIPAATYGFQVGNTSTATITGKLILFTVTGAGVLTPIAESTGTVAVAGNGVSGYSITLASDITVTGDTIAGLGFRLTNVQSAAFRWECLTIVPSDLQVNANVDHLAIREFSIGQACYPRDSVRAGELDDLFSNCLLYAPVACSSVFNVTQLLKDAGGNMLSAYLPSRTQLPSDPRAAWDSASALKRSYPVATNKFQHGAHASWVGARIQDYEFRRPFSQVDWTNLNYESLPSTYFIAQRALSAEASAARYYLEFNTAWAIQTLDPKVSMSITPSCPQFLILFMSIVACNPLLVGENPDHLTRIKELAVKIASDPRVHQLVKMGLSKALPMLLAAMA